MKTVFTTGQLAKFIETNEHQEVNPEAFQRGLSKGIFADVAEAISLMGNDDIINRNEVRKALGLDPKYFYLEGKGAIDKRLLGSPYLHFVDRGIETEVLFPKPTELKNVTAEFIHIDFSGLNGSGAPDYVFERYIEAVKELGFRFASVGELLLFNHQWYHQFKRKPRVVTMHQFDHKGRTCLPMLVPEPAEGKTDRAALLPVSRAEVMRSQDHVGLIISK